MYNWRKIYRFSFNRVKPQIISFLLSERPRAIAIVGSYGSGKTTVLRYIEDEIKQICPLYFTIYVSLKPEVSFYKAFETGAKRLMKREPAVKCYEPITNTKQVSMFLMNARKTLLRRSLLIFDDLSSENFYSLYQLLSAEKEIDKTIFAMDYSRWMHIDDRMAKKVPVIPLLKMTLEETKQLLRMYLGEQLELFTEEALLQLWILSTGSPRKILKFAYLTLKLAAETERAKIELETINNAFKEGELR